MQVKKNVKRTINATLKNYELNPQKYYRDIQSLLADKEKPIPREVEPRRNYDREY
jgi:hypothetical protein